MIVVMDMSSGRIMEESSPLCAVAAASAYGDPVEYAAGGELPQIAARLEEVVCTRGSEKAVARRGLMATLYAASA